MIQIVETPETLQIVRQLHPFLPVRMLHMDAILPGQHGHIVVPLDWMMIRWNDTERANRSGRRSRLDTFDSHIIQDRIIADRLIGTDRIIRVVVAQQLIIHHVLVHVQ